MCSEQLPDDVWKVALDEMGLDNTEEERRFVVDIFGTPSVWQITLEGTLSKRMFATLQPYLRPIDQPGQLGTDVIERLGKRIEVDCNDFFWGGVMSTRTPFDVIVKPQFRDFFAKRSRFIGFIFNPAASDLQTALLNESRWDESLLRCLLANLRTTGPQGFRSNRLTESVLQEKGWQGALIRARVRGSSFDPTLANATQRNPQQSQNQEELSPCEISLLP